MISNLINELKNLKSMNMLNNIIVGVGAFMWISKTNMTYFKN